uniref:Mitochondrial import inner membrane translocase subunit TIM50 n=1 Tax=Ananas comosus var. bracteatus TaxID=296719 RepID=A0A6V7Q9I7_ANACO|nr:unnamed protein product [Ananas comosus var. bracteatus]
MSRIARSRSLPTLLSRRSRSLSSSSTLSSSSYSSSSSSEAAAAAAAEEHVAGERPPPTPPPSTGARKSRSLLKFGAFASLAGVLGAAGYATYAYTLDEVDQKTSSFRKTANLSVGDDAPTFEKFRALIYSTAMKVPVKAIELYLDIRSKVEEHVRGFTEPSSDKLLPDLLPEEQHVYTLVLDLNETLVYSDWQRDRGWRTFKRPGVEAFLEHLAKFYEIVVYSDQLNMYVDPVVERLDQKGCIRYKLSRAATKYQNGKHYRDLSKLNRDPSRILYVSGHCLESTLQPENCVSIKPWKLENDDTALLDLLPFLEFVAVHRPADIRSVLASYQGCDIATEFIERSKEMKSDGDGRDLRDEDEENDDNGENVGEEEDTYLSDGVEEEDDDSDFRENILNGLEDSAVVEDCSWSVSTTKSKRHVLQAPNESKKGKKNRFYIVSALAGTKVDLKILSQRLGLGCEWLQAPEEALQEVLQVVPLGCVSPFAVINESARDNAVPVQQAAESPAAEQQGPFGLLGYCAYLLRLQLDSRSYQRCEVHPELNLKTLLG